MTKRVRSKSVANRVKLSAPPYVLLVALHNPQRASNREEARTVSLSGVALLDFVREGDGRYVRCEP